ncbi:hypothetical protein C8Q77DRAFT_1058494, partial [Trametes polyzona]
MASEGHTTRATSPFTTSEFSSIGSTRSIMGMPVEGTKLAPKVFRGNPAEVETFLRRFERLALLHNLTERERCETVTDYCSRVVRETIEGFPAFRNGNWTQLKANIRVFWNADLESKRFRLRDLQAFAIKSRKQPILELREWRTYLRRFVRIAGWLQGQGKLSDTDYAYYMWTGLPSSFRKRLEVRLLLEDPHHDMSEPFEPEDIRKAAEAILGLERFDTERLGAGDFSDEDSDDEIEDVTEPRKRNRNQDRKIGTGYDALKRMLDEDSEDDSDSDAEERLSYSKDKQGSSLRKTADARKKHEGKKKFEEDKEFDQLVEKMQRMSLDDPQYGFLYLKVCGMRPLAAECLPKPIMRTSTPIRREQPRDQPPHVTRVFPDRTLSRPLQPSSDCFGCGQSGHIMRDCPTINEFLNRGLVMRDFHGRLVRGDGGPLRRIHGETWVDAIRRDVPGVHFISYGGRIHEAEEEDNLETDGPADVMVYPVERSQRETRSYRKQAFDGVRVPQPDKGKQRETTNSRKAATATSRFPMQRLTPVETQRPTFNPDNDTEMIEDRTQPQQQKTQTPRASQQTQPNQSTPNTQAERARAPVRRSQLNREVDSDDILNKILNSELTMSVREVVGVSKEVASRLQDVLKVRRADFVAPPASNLITTPATPLIRVEVECNHKPVSFIVDTGSQLNIISEKVCKNIVRRPINTNEAISMNDANGGTGRLLGLVEDVPIQFGHVKTPISAYVAESPPFDGLLGRPWQRAHKIGIEEREDGTYLTF